MQQEKTEKVGNGNEIVFDVDWKNIPEECLECLFITSPEIVVKALSN